MVEPVGPFHLLRAAPGRFLCYCGPDGAVYVTDAMEVWAGELGDGPALGCRCPPEEHGAMLRAALGHGAAALSLGPGSATLRLPEEPRCPALALAQLPAAEARNQLRALVFGMAGCIESLERRLEAAETLASSCSPEKNAARSQQLFLPGRRCQGHLPWSCSLVSSPPWRLLVLYPCALQDTRSALGCGCWQPPIVLVLFRAEQGQGSMWWLSGCLGCSGQRLGIASLRRAGFAVLLDWRLWQVHGSFWERRPSLALPCALWLLVLPGWAPAGSLWPWRDWQGCQSSWLTCDLCPACS
ncbi:protein PAXX isoform X3 [Corvus moneduloides]|uniref:protein PAXX isoform X3 n=1 Tax=Corvus moneduloides TaxID=1196302 RepID=UPI0013640C92|nr:protein PAXX isoform X3 [Corvus moneduloides]